MPRMVKNEKSAFSISKMQGSVQTTSALLGLQQQFYMFRVSVSEDFSEEQRMIHCQLVLTQSFWTPFVEFAKD
jgi:hypothetical protein